MCKLSKSNGYLMIDKHVICMFRKGFTLQIVFEKYFQTSIYRLLGDNKAFGYSSTCPCLDNKFYSY